MKFKFEEGSRRVEIDLSNSDVSLTDLRNIVHGHHDKLMKKIEARTENIYGLSEWFSKLKERIQAIEKTIEDMNQSDVQMRLEKRLNKVENRAKHNEEGLDDLNNALGSFERQTEENFQSIKKWSKGVAKFQEE